ncbi:metallophosphoesterase [Thalassotalea crassostreae]|uniref:metallophosphoesterase n=1 Tax=Thalassotalea crassostreae TaxID=1763536 RepID=UPI0008399F54|nr:metallophosphoesterase [Thalassotalea crassostreae]
MPSITIAQFSDSHLFALPEQRHYGANVLQNLNHILQHINQNQQVEHVIFTGDLSQDHSLESYQQFNQSIANFLTKPLAYIAGNHDDLPALSNELTATTISHDAQLALGKWQILLLNSKSNTPAGLVAESELERIVEGASNSANQLLFMHHHPRDVGYFIDRHGLENKQQFWSAIDQNNRIKLICCGHVHRAEKIAGDNRYKVDVLTCPATSIQFDPKVDGVAALPIGPGYRLITLHDDGSYDTETVFLTAQ